MKIDGAAAIGSEAARNLARRRHAVSQHVGAKVVVADLAADRANALAREIGGSAWACDVTKSETVQAAVD
jgi:NADP-dependent 3-hydroxy acid dehydrogenase YdfG